MTEIIIGIDIGTGSTKAIAFDIDNATILESINCFYPTEYRGDRHEQNPLLIYDAFKKAFRTLTGRLSAHRLSGVVFSSAMHSVIAVDKAGNPLTNCIIWSDKRSTRQAKEIGRSPEAGRIYRETGTPIHPMSPLCKIAYIRDELPDIFRETAKFISAKAYILHRLGHEFFIDHSLASATGLFDIEKLQWHAPALDAAGIGPDYLSLPVPTTHVMKAGNSDEIRSLGITDDTPLIIGGGDGPLANLGSLTMQPNQGCLTLGTSGAFRITSREICTDPSESIFNYIIDEHLYTAGGAVNNGGIVLKWLQSLFGENGKGEEDFQKLLDTAAGVKPGAEGLIFLPWILGERAPVWDTDSKGMYYGVSFHHRPPHFMRAGLEGICFNLLNIAEIMQRLSGNINQVHFNGGLARSEFFTQMLADIFGVEIKVVPGIDISAYGGVIMALKTLGYIRNFEEAPELSKQSQTFYPAPRHHAIYQENFEKFKTLIDFNSTGNPK